ncbi:MAG: prepilin-type N-terminal cleavage/methylation domain-containing protein [Candidatus Wallbacteria bacterium]|nr:prepilin-type N-terminal cleavage/methylation domain-containing protein [Candidatus Wallbacteria bacterium]
MKRKGFTLIEIVVSTVIICLLASISVPLGEMMFQTSRASEVTTTLDDLRQSLEDYKAETGHYPQIREGETPMDALNRTLVGSGLLKSFPKNPVTNSPWDWEIKDSVTGKWSSMDSQKARQVSMPDGSANQYATAVYVPVATAVFTQTYYNAPTDVYDIRFPKSIDLKKDDGTYYHEF